MARQQHRIAELGDILISDQLALRRAVAPRHHAEIPVLHELARHLITTPQAIMDRLVEFSLRLCGGQSGGISLSEVTPEGDRIFRWHALKGRFIAYAGVTAPRDFSPCGVVLDQKKPVLMQSPERYYPYLTLKGAPIWEGLLVPLPGENGDIYGTLWVATHDPRHKFTQDDCDTLGRLATFASIGLVLSRAAMEKDKLLAEKESLLDQLQMTLREVNHRVSNSLQLANSLLRLQGRKSESADAKRELHEAANRIGSITLVHTRLYKDGNMAAVEVGRYLRDLCADLTASVRGQDPDAAVRVEIVIPREFTLPPDAMTRIGLIVNELVTNAIKHASGASCCKVSATETSGVLRLAVSDDGAGLADGFEIGAQKGLGMQMVHSLLDQMAGTLAAEPSLRGARFVVTMPMPVATPPSHVPETTVSRPPSQGTACAA